MKMHGPESGKHVCRTALYMKMCGPGGGKHVYRTALYLKMRGRGSGEHVYRTALYMKTHGPCMVPEVETCVQGGLEVENIGAGGPYTGKRTVLREGNMCPGWPYT